MSKLKKTTLYIKGMHCDSCEVLIQDSFKELKNIKEVQADHRKQCAHVTYTGQLDTHVLNSKINQFGYAVSHQKITEHVPLSKRLTETGTIAVILFILYYFAQELHLIPQFNMGSNLTLLTVFLLGIVASTSTCMATSGALFLSTIGKLRTNGTSFKENIVPVVSFNLGRIISYGVFGFLVGLLGKTLTQNLQLGSVLNFIVAVFMVLIGLNMLQLLPFSFSGTGSFSRKLFEKLEEKFIQHPKQTAFFLGAITYLLPCGFTQSVQIYALGLANPWLSSVTMMIFALGTMPMLMAIGFTSSFTQSSFYPLFTKVIGIVIFVIGISYFNNALNLYGIHLAAVFQQNQITTGIHAQETADSQTIQMDVDYKGYSPSQFVVKQGKTVRWIINGKDIYGCQGTITSPKLGIYQTLKSGENVIEFTPQEKGPIAFSCSMGMFRGTINVI